MIGAQDELRKLQDSLATAKEAKQTEWISYFQDSIEDLWNRNLVSKCDCGEYVTEQGPCNKCQWHTEIRKSDEQDYQSRNF